MQTASNNDTYILFEVGGTTYGLNSAEVQHMEIVEHVTPVPNAPPFFEGVVYSRAQVIPVINLRLRFGFSHQEHTLRSRLIVVQVGQRRVGLIVDAAREFRRIPAETILSPEQAIAGMSEKHVQGIAPEGERLIFILNIAEVLKTTVAEEGRLSAAPATAD